MECQLSAGLVSWFLSGITKCMAFHQLGRHSSVEQYVLAQSKPTMICYFKLLLYRDLEMSSISLSVRMHHNVSTHFKYLYHEEVIRNRAES